MRKRTSFISYSTDKHHDFVILDVQKSDRIPTLYTIILLFQLWHGERTCPLMLQQNDPKFGFKQYTVWLFFFKKKKISSMLWILWSGFWSKTFFWFWHIFFGGFWTRWTWRASTPDVKPLELLVKHGQRKLLLTSNKTKTGEENDTKHRNGKSFKCMQEK